MLDGLAVAESTVVVAIGLDITGTKHLLGLWLGSTENAPASCGIAPQLPRAWPQDSFPLLVVIDGARGLRKALEAVLGSAAIVQRCQLPKLRNVKSHLPKGCHPYVSRVMPEAYRSATASTAAKRLRSLVSWLDSNGHVAAARSLREGLEETLTVITLGLPATPCRILSTTNPIENLKWHDSARDTQREPLARWPHGPSLGWSCPLPRTAELVPHQGASRSSPSPGCSSFCRRQPINR